ncbi:MAG: ribonuclease E/G, partial [Pseudomonadota bacterium]
NLEAADEVARQLRLRDLAGLIVIDFIDMDDKRHNRQVEKRLKDALKMDRSRIQVGRISPFGLMEMSRQRIRQGMVETSMTTCPTCSGIGHVRSTQSVALYCLRSLEEHLLKNGNNHVTIRTSSAVALYILNQKRAHLNALEERFGLDIGVHADEQLSGQHMEIVTGERVEREPGEAPPMTQIAPDAVDVDTDDDEDEDQATQEAAEGDGERSSSRRRRRRRRRGGSSEGGSESREDADETSAAGAEDGEAVAARDAGEAGSDGDGDGEDGRRSRRRRGRRGGRRHRREDEANGHTAEADADTATHDAEPTPEVAAGSNGEATMEPTSEPGAPESTFENGEATEPAV